MNSEELPVSRSRTDLLLNNLKTHPIRSVIVIGLFIIYLPIMYQIHLNLVAAKVGTTAGGYYWGTMGYSLFPFPYDASWIGSGVAMAITQLTPIEVYIYTHFYPSIAPRIMWSVVWLTLGITYLIWPLLSSSTTKETAVSQEKSPLNSEESPPRFKWKYQMQPREVILLLLFVLLFLPTFATLRNLSNSLAYSIDSWTWRLLFYRDGHITFREGLSLFYLQYHFLKYLLVFQYYRYNRYATTRKRVLLVAILSELQMILVIDVPMLIQVIQGVNVWTNFVWYIPIPIVLIISIILLIFVPRPESEPMWIDKEKKKSWWQK